MLTTEEAMHAIETRQSDAFRRANTLAAFNRMSDSEWTSLVLFFREQLVTDQQLLWNLVRERAEKRWTAAGPEGNGRTLLSQVQGLLVELGLRIAVAP